MNIVIIIGAALMIYLCRLSGFLLSDRLTTASWNRRLSFVPIGVFSALIVTSVMGQPTVMMEKGVLLLVIGLFIKRTRRLGMGIVLGFVIFWALDILR